MQFYANYVAYNLLRRTERVYMRRSISIAFGLFLWSTVLPPFHFAQTDKLSPETRKQLDVTTVRFMAKNNLPGISIAVVENGEYEWSKGFGMADLESLAPATSQTLYRLASVSKPITAAASLGWLELFQGRSASGLSRPEVQLLDERLHRRWVRD